ncbi:HEAT repeat domain-containing protein [Poriferisphaera sp. WC338]|uniref:HEAT repeat domain-containing protein n=1 Tax=Poriferisphaera sp. WC338 TaxID=3425129 RepID=UPI003D81BA54
MPQGSYATAITPHTDRRDSSAIIAKSAYLITLILVLLLNACAAPIRNIPPQTLLQDSQTPAEVREQLQPLIDVRLPADQRRTAALALLSMKSRRAELAVASILYQTDDEFAALATVEAITVTAQDPSSAYLAPLQQLLLRAEGDLQNKTAEALGRMTDRKRIVDWLIKQADAPQSPYSVRRGAILALGYQRTQTAAQSLINLADPSQPRQIQKDAFTALTLMTGLEDLRENHTAWLDWWQDARRWKEGKWQAELVKNASRRTAMQQIAQKQVIDSLIELSRANYRNASDPDKPKVLVYMLSENVDPVRKLAMELILERLLDGQPFEEDLRTALRARLSDPVSDIRQQAAMRLHDLADEPAADLVAARLASSHESTTSVLRANLLLLTRMPRTNAVSPALDLLAKASLHDAAAGMLAAAADKDMLSEKHATEAARHARRHLKKQTHPAPQVVTLLGRVGNTSDWGRIADWVDSDNASVKQAAATAWAESDRSLKLLADRVQDPVIQPIVIGAATRRGEDPFTLLELVKFPPQREQALDAWGRALVAMSARVPAESVLQAVAIIGTPDSTSDARATFIDQMLGAAIDRPDANLPLTDRQRALIFLKRAEIRLHLANSAAALLDYQQVDASITQLSAHEREQFLRGYITSQLHLNAIDGAFASAKRLLDIIEVGGRTGTDDPIVNTFIEQAKRYIAAKRTDEARQIVTSLRTLLGTMKPQVATRLRLLDAQLPAVESPSEPALPVITDAPSEPAESGKATAAKPEPESDSVTD